MGNNNGRDRLLHSVHNILHLALETCEEIIREGLCDDDPRTEGPWGITSRSGRQIVGEVSQEAGSPSAWVDTWYWDPDDYGTITP